MVRAFVRSSSALAAFLIAGATQAAGLPPTAPLTAYGDLPAIQDAALSPSGKNVAIVINNGVQPLLVLIGEDHRPKAQLLLGSEKVRGVMWFGDDAVLLETSQTEKLPEVYTGTRQMELGVGRIVRMDNSQPQVVFARNHTMLSSIFGTYGFRQVGGQWNGFFGGMQLAADGNGHYNLDGGTMGLYQVDAVDNARVIASEPPQNHGGEWLVDKNGKVAATFDISAGSGAWSISNAQGTVIATGLQDKGNVGIASLGKDGTTVLYHELDSKTSTRRWYEVPLTGGAPREVFADTRFDDFYVDRATGRMIGYLPAGHDDAPVFFDPAKQAAARRVLASFPEGHTRFVEWSASFDKALVQTSGDHDSGSWYVVDATTLDKVRLGQERAGIGPDMVGPVSTFSYKAADGLDMDGILTLPPGGEAKNLPAIMLPHGGPASEDIEHFDWWAQALASRGYAVFQPNFRGSTNKGAAFELAGNGEWGRKMQTDISDGLTALAKAGIVDPKRVCIVGASYGGYAALAGVTLQHGIYKCAVSVAGVSDIKALEEGEYWESGNSKVLKRNLMAMLGPKEDFDKISPIKHISEVDVPILLIHGRDDTVVQFSQTSNMVDALKDAGKPYEFVLLKDEDHWLSRGTTRNQMLAATVAFVEKYNPAN